MFPGYANSNGADRLLPAQHDDARERHAHDLLGRDRQPRQHRRHRQPLLHRAERHRRDDLGGSARARRVAMASSRRRARPDRRNGLAKCRRTTRSSRSRRSRPTIATPELVFPEWTGDIQRPHARDRTGRGAAGEPFDDGRRPTKATSSSTAACVRSRSGRRSTRAPGVFTWQPGPGFVGRYEFVFLRTAPDGIKTRIPVNVTISPKHDGDDDDRASRLRLRLRVQQSFDKWSEVQPEPLSPEPRAFCYHPPVSIRRETARVAVVIVNYQSYDELHGCLASIEPGVRQRIDRRRRSRERPRRRRPPEPAVSRTSQLQRVDRQRRLRRRRQQRRARHARHRSSCCSIPTACSSRTRAVVWRTGWRAIPTSPSPDRASECRRHRPAVGAPLSRLDDGDRRPQLVADARAARQSPVAPQSARARSRRTRRRSTSTGCRAPACCVRRDAFDAVGGLDEGFFLYWEDADFCRRLKHAGWRTMYVPTAGAMHVGGRSSRHAADASLEAFHRSAFRLYRKHAGPVGPAAHAVRLRRPAAAAGVHETSASDSRRT